jgi:hypothetical protein
MKLVIAGSRHLDVPREFIDWCTDQFPMEKITEVVSGTAKGVDSSGESFTDLYSNIKLKQFPADWDKYGKTAGHIRNKEMAEYGDALLLIWDGESKGSANMKFQMEKLGKPVYEFILKKVY